MNKKMAKNLIIHKITKPNYFTSDKKFINGSIEIKTWILNINIIVNEILNLFI